MEKLLFEYRNTVNGIVGENYRKEYFKRYSPPYYCKQCGKKFNSATMNCTIDHIIPKSVGGSNSMANLQVLCRRCNEEKKDLISTLSVKNSGEALIREIKRKLGY